MYILLWQQKNGDLMKLTKHTDYAFRVLIYLASTKQERSTILEISDMFKISKTHVMKIVNELVNIGWVASVRGKNGGIYLGVNPRDINLREVVTQMEKTLDPINCAEPICFINGICGLKPILMTAQDKYLEHLAQFTLDDLMNKKVLGKLS